MSLLSLLSAGTFKQDTPLHCPHAVVHRRPFFRKVHDFLSHFPPQLQRIVRRSCSGAASFDILKGTKPEGDTDHPQFSGRRLLPRHVCTWWYVRRLWKRPACTVGGSFSGGTYHVDVATFAWNLSNRADDRLDAVAHPYIMSSARSPSFSMSDFEEVGNIKVDAEFSKAVYFFRTPTLPIPKGRDVVSHPLTAWRNSRFFVKSGSNLLLKVVMHTFCFAVIM